MRMSWEIKRFFRDISGSRYGNAVKTPFLDLFRVMQSIKTRYIFSEYHTLPTLFDFQPGIGMRYLPNIPYILFVIF